jgi:DNA helicase II / ATP-dependent DNA helicase PcrA
MREDRRVHKGSAFQLPAIDDADITWACEIMRLPPTAFTGHDGNDPRSTVLKSMETLDVEACPGSGKTTLLVAKLAVIANKWTNRRQGVCVLSHTNAARTEIEGPLSTCPAGNALLRYPHFVGTIHSFVNELLAVPWLRSCQFPIRAIDDEICLNVRWKKLPHATRAALTTNKYDKHLLRYISSDFCVGNIRWGSSGQLGINTPTYQEIVSACRQASEDGYFCHDEMFVWAKKLLDSCPRIIEAIRWRFPLVFIDEVQDNSETQSALLHRLFRDGQSSVVRQRFGDSNQAIYERHDEANGVQTDIFPCLPKTDLPNSFRFGQAIADHANPFAVHPQALVGQGPSRKSIVAECRQNTLILFGEGRILDVLPTYAAHLLTVFSTEELAAGVFTAVAAVHTPRQTQKLPHFLGQYAPGYEPEIARKSTSPRSFINYVRAGRRDLLVGGNVYPLVSQAAAGILRLAQITNPELSLTQRKSTHRQVLEQLENNLEVSRSYVAFVDHLILSRGELTEAAWAAEQRVCVKHVAETIAGMPAASEDCTAFLEWITPPASAGIADVTTSRENVYRYPPGSPLVAIRLGSIHSVKGETHTATLVLDSFYRTYHLKKLKPWLLGQKTGDTSQDLATQGRLRLHYVAITRPSHLLCLGMRRDTFSDSEIATLKGRGWQIILRT